MAALSFSLPATTVALTAATPETVLGANPAANYRVELFEWSVSFDGATSTNAPAVVSSGQLTFGANAPGTNSTTVTGVKDDPDNSPTIQTALAKIWTAEPTTYTIADTIDVGAFNGTFRYLMPDRAPIILKNNVGWGLRITIPNNANTTCRARFRE